MRAPDTLRGPNGREGDASVRIYANDGKDGLKPLMEFGGKWNNNKATCYVLAAAGCVISTKAFLRSGKSPDVVDLVVDGILRNSVINSHHSRTYEPLIDRALYQHKKNGKKSGGLQFCQMEVRPRNAEKSSTLTGPIDLSEVGSIGVHIFKPFLPMAEVSEPTVRAPNYEDFAEWHDLNRNISPTQSSPFEIGLTNSVSVPKSNKKRTLTSLSQDYKLWATFTFHLRTREQLIALGFMQVAECRSPVIQPKPTSELKPPAATLLLPENSTSPDTTSTENQTAPLANFSGGFSQDAISSTLVSGVAAKFDELLARTPSSSPFSPLGRTSTQSILGGLIARKDVSQRPQTTSGLVRAVIENAALQSSMLSNEPERLSPDKQKSQLISLDDTPEKIKTLSGLVGGNAYKAWVDRGVTQNPEPSLLNQIHEKSTAAAGLVRERAHAAPTETAMPSPESPLLVVSKQHGTILPSIVDRSASQAFSNNGITIGSELDPVSVSNPKAMLLGGDLDSPAHRTPRDETTTPDVEFANQKRNGTDQNSDFISPSRSPEPIYQVLFDRDTAGDPLLEFDAQINSDPHSNNLSRNHFTVPANSRNQLSNNTPRTSFSNPAQKTTGSGLFVNSPIGSTFNERKLSSQLSQVESPQQTILASGLIREVPQMSTLHGSTKTSKKRTADSISNDEPTVLTDAAPPRCALSVPSSLATKNVDMANEGISAAETRYMAALARHKELKLVYGNILRAKELNMKASGLEKAIEDLEAHIEAEFTRQ